jgi:hypothetical protein
MTMPCTKQVLLHRVSHQVWREIDYILKRPTLVEQSKHLEWFAKSVRFKLRLYLANYIIFNFSI